MSNGKPFLSYAQQMRLLRDEKKLVIADDTYANDVLHRLGYYALISGYKELFRNKTLKRYRDGTTFEEIVALYQFDADLRELFLKYLLQIEQNMRSLLSYCFTEQHGNSQSEYLDASNYNNSMANAVGLQKLIKDLRYIAVQSNDYNYITHQRKNYGNVPLWALVKVLTFGKISKMFAVFPQNLQSKVCRNFSGVTQRELTQYLRVLTKFRNVCAHSERLFSYTVTDSIPDTPLHKKLGISQRGAQYMYGKRDLFSVVIAFRYLLPKSDFNDFKSRLSRLIGKFLENIEHATYEELLHKMGFPLNWKKISKYKL